jgi:hypothetical protein
MPDITEAPNRDDLTMVYLASTTAEAEAVQNVLDTEGIEHFTGLTPYRRSDLISRLLQSKDYQGVGFYVLRGRADPVRAVLRGEGFVRGIVAERP